MLNRKENGTQNAFHRKFKYNVDFGFLIFILKTNYFIFQISETLSKLTNYLSMSIEKDSQFIHKISIC